MSDKLLLYFLLLCGIGIFQKSAQFEINLKKASSSDEYLNLDYVNLNSQLESIKLRFDILQYQLDKQKELWHATNTKLDKITLSLQNLQSKISEENEEYTSQLNDAMNTQNQLLNSKFLAPAVDGKWEILTDIKETLKIHVNSVENVEEKLKNIENILSIGKWRMQTQELNENISDNFPLLQNIEKIIMHLETAAATKEQQMVLNRNLQNYLNRKEVTKICLKGDNEKLICTSESYPTSCANFNDKYCFNNKCRIINTHFGPDPFLVPCDDETEGGGWTIIQRRFDGSMDFYRDWLEYKNGFGDINGEFFIGLDKLNALTTALKPVEILIQLEDFNNTMKYAKYDEFDVGNETENYKLIKVGNYAGNAGDCFSQHTGYSFSTKDRDNDGRKDENCASLMKGAWWYRNCSYCNLNGMYYNTKLEFKTYGIFWCLFHGDRFSLKSVQMSIRPRRI